MGVPGAERTELRARVVQGPRDVDVLPPPMPSASVGDLLAVGGKKVGTRGTRQVWASHVRPTPGMNCEEEWINGELVWACYI